MMPIVKCWESSRRQPAGHCTRVAKWHAPATYAIPLRGPRASHSCCGSLSYCCRPAPRAKARAEAPAAAALALQRARQLQRAQQLQRARPLLALPRAKPAPPPQQGRPAQALQRVPQLTRYGQLASVSRAACRVCCRCCCWAVVTQATALLLFVAWWQSCRRCLPLGAAEPAGTSALPPYCLRYVCYGSLPICSSAAAAACCSRRPRVSWRSCHSFCHLSLFPAWPVPARNSLVVPLCCSCAQLPACLPAHPLALPGHTCWSALLCTPAFPLRWGWYRPAACDQASFSAPKLTLLTGNLALLPPLVCPCLQPPWAATTCTTAASLTLRLPRVS